MLIISIISLIFAIISLIVQYAYLYKVKYMCILTPIGAFISVISGFLLLIINPGIIYSDGEKVDYNQRIYCRYCKYLYPKSNKKMEHCSDCGICVCKIDHHCGVTGKCVGKFNIVIFFLFVVGNMFFILCLHLILFFCLSLKKK